MRVSLNTGDPAVLGASLVGEYALCRETFGWSDEGTRAVARTSIEATFADAETKAGLSRTLEAW